MEEKKKSSKGKWIIAIVIIAVIAAVALAFYNGIFSMPTGLVAGTQTTVNPPAPSTPQQPTFTTTGTEIIAKEVNESLPYYESADLEPGKYSLQVITDKPVWIIVYDETHFNEWKNRGNGGSALLSTGSTKETEKVTSFSDSFYIGANGKYYVVLEGSGEASIKFKITQIFKT
jgi:hypothetical protein